MCTFVLIKTLPGFNRNVLLLMVCSLYIQQISAQQKAVYPFEERTRRILLLGNSITYAGQYVSYMETYFKLHYPARQPEWINAGLPSETVSGLSEPGHADGQFPRPDLHDRLERVLSLTKPDVVFACYGMNDGIYMPFDEARFRAYRDGMRWLHNALKAHGVQRVIFLTPPVHDDPQLGTRGYNLVLDQYSDWLLSQRDSLGWQVADIHSPMTRFLDSMKQVRPGFYLAKDGVHPGEQGHWIMAKALLLSLGQQVQVAPDFDAAITAFPHAAEVAALVSERQAIMKDAWLTATGHKRPGMNKGMPLQEARSYYDSVEHRIAALLPAGDK